MLTWVFEVLVHLRIRSVEPAGAFSGTTHIFSHEGTGCISCLRAASVVAELTPTLRLVAMVQRIMLFGVKTSVDAITYIFSSHHSPTTLAATISLGSQWTSIVAAA